MKTCGANFENILQLSAYKEQRKLERSLENFMFDEYRLDEKRNWQLERTITNFHILIK